jgi:hypothetical protein
LVKGDSEINVAAMTGYGQSMSVAFQASGLYDLMLALAG